MGPLLILISLATLLARSDDRQALLTAVGKDMRDLTAKLVYADYLDEHGEASHAEYVRLNARLLDPAERLSSKERARIEKRIANLLSMHEVEWVPFPKTRHEVSYTWRGGFIFGVHATPQWLREHEHQVFKRIPTLEYLELGRWGCPGETGVGWIPLHWGDEFNRLGTLAWDAAGRGEIGAVNWLLGSFHPPPGGHAELSRLLDRFLLRVPIDHLSYDQKVAVSCITWRYLEAWKEGKVVEVPRWETVLRLAAAMRSLGEKTEVIGELLFRYGGYGFQYGDGEELEPVAYHLDAMSTVSLVRLYGQTQRNSRLARRLQYLLVRDRWGELQRLAYPWIWSANRALRTPARAILRAFEADPGGCIGELRDRI